MTFYDRILALEKYPFAETLAATSADVERALASPHISPRASASSSLRRPSLTLSPWLAGPIHSRCSTLAG